jgi:hypothetical protein
MRSDSARFTRSALSIGIQIVARVNPAATRSKQSGRTTLNRAAGSSRPDMNTLLVYMVNPQHIEQVNAFLLANNGRELSPDTGWWRIETDMSFKHAFLQLWYWVGDQGFLRIVELSGKRQSFAFPSYKRSELFKSEGILEKLSSYGRKLEDL